MRANELAIATFMHKIEHWNVAGIIGLAEREATHAERRFHRLKGRLAIEGAAHLSYAENLKQLIRFLRYGVQPSRLGVCERIVFQKIKTRVEQQPVCFVSKRRRRVRPKRHIAVPNQTTYGFQGADGGNA